MSSCGSEVLSNHKVINYIGSQKNPNANLPHKPKTFDRVDCGVMYTNQAQGDARTTAECQYLSEAGLCLLLMEKEK